jgi:formylglycine-generating enzyme required for sulfatase activity
MRQLFIKLALRSIAVLTLLLSLGAVRVNADIHYVDMTKVGNTRIQNLHGQYGLDFPTDVPRVTHKNITFELHPEASVNAYLTSDRPPTGSVYYNLTIDLGSAGIAQPKRAYVLINYWQSLSDDWIGTNQATGLGFSNSSGNTYGEELRLGVHVRNYRVGGSINVDPNRVRTLHAWQVGDKQCRLDMLEFVFEPNVDKINTITVSDTFFRNCMISGIAIENDLDSFAPTSTFSSSPSTSWSKSDVTATINASDVAGGKGVKEIHYTVNMGQEQVVTGSSASFTLTEEGIQSIAYWAVDNAGNVEATKYGTVRIDKTAPTVDGYVVSGKLMLMASDVRSGLAGIKYSLDGAAAADYSAPLTIPAGAHTYSYWSVDNAGNESVKETILVGSTVSVTIAPTSVYASKASVATIKLSVAAPAGGVTVMLSSDNPAVTIAPSVKLNAGATTINVPVQTGAVAADTSAVITASVGGTEAYGTLTVLVPFPKTLIVTPNVIIGGNSAVGTITLQSNAPAGGQVVTLVSKSVDVIVPATVTVPVGAISATFPVTTRISSIDYSAAIDAEADGAGVGTTVLIKRVTPKSVTFVPSTVPGGNASVGTVTLSVAAPAGGAVVQLKSTSSFVTVPASVTVAEGKTTATFDIATSVTPRTVLANVQATAAGVRVAGILTVSGVNVTSITLAPSSVLGGSSTTGTVNLNTNAPTGGLTVQLYTLTGIAGAPTSVTVAAGQKTATFTVTTVPVSASAQTQIVGKYLGVVKTATLTVQAAGVSSLTLNPTSVNGGFLSTMTINLTGLAGPSGLVVALTSSNLNAATVPATVTVPSGTNTVDVVVTTKPVTATTTVTLTAKTSASSKTVVLTVKKPSGLLPHLAQYKSEMVSINGQFKMGRTEVTVAMWKEYCAATGKSMPGPPPHGWVDNHPMVKVSQGESIQYGDWAGLRLPSVQEWDLAATGGDGRNYPWGGFGSQVDPKSPSLKLYGGWDPDKCVNSTVTIQNGPSPVGSKPAGNSPYGCMDMVGNVFEWTTEMFREYPSHRGASWSHTHQHYFAMESNRFWGGFHSTDIGFRLAGPQ